MYVFELNAIIPAELTINKGDHYYQIRMTITPSLSFLAADILL